MGEDKSDKIIDLLEDIRKWVKFQGWRDIKEILLDTLKYDEDKIVFHYSDGRSSRAVAREAPVSRPTILKMWEKWAKIGIVEPMQVQRGTRYRRIFSLDEFGIDLPEITPTQPTSGNTEDASRGQDVE